MLVMLHSYVALVRKDAGVTASLSPRHIVIDDTELWERHSCLSKLSLGAGSRELRLWCSAFGTTL